MRNHPGLTKLKVESYIAVPLFRRGGVYFGTLCALDTKPANLSEADFAVFELMSQLITLELEAEEEHLNQEVEISALTDIIFIASHDLLQPLSALLLRSQLAVRNASREGVSPNLISHLERMGDDIKRTVQLTNKLLDVGRIRAGTFQLELTETDLHALITQVINDIKVSMPAYTIDLEVQPPDQPFPLTGDAARLSQVIRNLLGNAVKYSPSSEKAIEVKVFKQLNPLGKSEAIVQIRDYGMGVQAEELPQLFEHHYRTEEAIASGIKGTGFGLFISRQIIEAHGGNLRAELPTGPGLLMTFSLPLQ